MSANSNTSYQIILEYIWLDASNNTRSKTKVILDNSDNYLNQLNEKYSDPSKLPIWNYDGSSTNQATTEESEIILKPVKVVSDPFRLNSSSTIKSYLVLCECYLPNGDPHKSNTRYLAKQLFDQVSDHTEPMFGLEQEFFISRKVG